MSEAYTSFADMASVPVDDLPETSNLPRGTYRWEVFAQPETKMSKAGFGELVNFPCRLVAPIDEFENPDALAEFIEKFDDVAGQNRTAMFYIPTKENPNSASTKSLKQQQAEALGRLRKFLTNVLGLSGETMNEMLSMAPGSQFLGTVEHEVDEDSSTPDEMVLREVFDARNFSPLG